MNQPIYAVYGCSGYGREVMPIARAQLQGLGLPIDRLVFIDDGANGSEMNGHRVMAYEAFLARPASERHVSVAIANGQIREQLASRLEEDGVLPWTVQAGNAVVLDQVVMGVGAILNPFVTITSNVVIGRYFQANLYSYVAHDCVIGDFVTFAPSVKCNGNIVIEDHAYIGTGAVIKQGKPGEPLVIGRGAIVGMGAVVTKNVAAGQTVVGNPAKLLLPKS